MSRMQADLARVKELSAKMISEIASLNLEDEISAEERGFDLSKKAGEFEVKIIRTARLKTWRTPCNQICSRKK